MERLTLEEAIKHARELAERNYKNVRTYPQELWKPGELENCQKCAEEHDQLAKWLQELKECRESENDNIFYQIRKKLKEDKIPENMEPFIKEHHYRSTENEIVLEVKIGWRERSTTHYL